MHACSDQTSFSETHIFSFVPEGGCGVQSPLRIGGKGSPALYTLYRLSDQFLVRVGVVFPPSFVPEDGCGVQSLLHNYDGKSSPALYTLYRLSD